MEETISKETDENAKKHYTKEIGKLLKLLIKKEKEFSGKGIENKKLYNKAKQIADKVYEKPSAYKSGFIIKKYKEMGGTYSGEKPKTTGIARWMKEEWTDVGNKEYPVFRPTKRITKDTPLTPQEIKPSNLKKQIQLKQIIKGEKNLPPFEPKKTGGKLEGYSTPQIVYKKAKKYLGKDVNIKPSDNPKKKYMVLNPNTNKWIYFGEMGYEDHTKHNDPIRRENYLNRTANMKGNWKNDKYSANNLSRNILW